MLVIHSAVAQQHSLSHYLQIHRSTCKKSVISHNSPRCSNLEAYFGAYDSLCSVRQMKITNLSSNGMSIVANSHVMSTIVILLDGCVCMSPCIVMKGLIASII